VNALVPAAEQANAHRMASKTQDVNSAKQNIVSCEAILRTRTLRSGRLKMRLGDTGWSSELLYAKKMVKAINPAVKHASSNVDRCF